MKNYKESLSKIKINKQIQLAKLRINKLSQLILLTKIPIKQKSSRLTKFNQKRSRLLMLKTKSSSLIKKISFYQVRDKS